MNGLFALLVLNLPVSVVGLFIAYSLAMFGQVLGGGDGLWVGIVTYVVWMTLVVMQASAFQAVRDARRGADPPRN